MCAWSIGVSLQAAPKPAPPPQPQRVYLPNIADEDWSFLADRTQRRDWLDPIKYVPLFGGRSYLTFGGEARIRPEGFHLRAAPGEDGVIDNYVFQRYLFAADWHIGRRLRLYGELQSGVIDGKLDSPRPTDQNVADVHQAFVEFRTLRERERQLRLTVGRQEMTIGSSRLISASQGLNVKRSFDGVVVKYDRGAWHFEGGSARLVAVTGGAFDDSSTWDQAFWGGSLARSGFVLKTATGGLYYLGVERDDSLYSQGRGHEVRHTLGGKFAGRWRALEFSYDVIGQWGEFADAPARAWAVATEHATRVRSWPLRPRFSVRFNSATGDRDPSDPRLESFNPLFPGSSYSGLVGLLGPTNLTDATPGVQFLLPHRVVLVVENAFYIRSSTGDGLYNIALRPLPFPRDNPERYVGTNPAFVAVWNWTTHLSLTGVITRFIPGGFAKPSFLQYGLSFYSASFTYRF